MKSELKRKLIGGLTTAFGAIWIWSCFYGPICSISSEEDLAESIWFLLTIVPLMALPGILAVYFGLQLYKEYKNSTVKWLVGIFTAYGVLFLSGRLEYALPDVLPESLLGNILLFAFTCLGIPFYVFCSQQIIKYVSGEIQTSSSLLNKGAILLLAWQLWMILFTAFDEYAPHKEGYTYVKTEPWGTIGFILSTFVPYLFYRILISKLMMAQQQPSSESPSSIQTG